MTKQYLSSITDYISKNVKKKDKLKTKKARLIFVINNNRENGGRMDQFLSRDFAVQSRAAHENWRAS